jgi:glycosyltransferase involved in cell wall biosynthesis
MSRRVRILHLISGLRQGGAESVLHRLCVASMGEADHRVISFTDGGVIGPRLVSAGIPTAYLGLPRGRFTFGGWRRLCRFIADQRPHVIQTWMYHADLIGGMAGRWLGIPVVWGIRTSSMDAHMTSVVTRGVIRACAIASHRLPTAMVSCSLTAADWHRKRGYAADRLLIVPNGYDVALYRPDERARSWMRDDWKISSTRFTIGVIGRWDSQKDHATLLAAMAQVRATGSNAVTILIGSGMSSDNSELRALLRQHGHDEDSVRCVGMSEDVPTSANAIDLLVMSSAYGEAFPNVVAESMSCGTPCVVTEVGDAPHILAGTGWVVPTRNPATMAESILQAELEWRMRPHEWRERQRSCRQRIVWRYSMERMTMSYCNIWKTVVRNQGLAISSSPNRCAIAGR